MSGCFLERFLGDKGFNTQNKTSHVEMMGFVENQGFPEDARV
jgi:hypothetical protein